MKRGYKLIFVIFLTLLLLFGLYATWRDINRFISLKEQIKELQTEVSDKEETYQGLSAIYDGVSEYYKYLLFLESSYTIKDFRYLLNQYGKNVAIKQIAKSDNKKLQRIELRVSMQISSPKSFFDLVRHIQDSFYAISIDYPVVFKKSGNLIDVGFEAFLYSFSKPSQTNPSKQNSPVKEEEL